MKKITYFLTCAAVVLFFAYYASAEKASVAYPFFITSCASIGALIYLEWKNRRILKVSFEPIDVRIGGHCVIRGSGFTPHRLVSMHVYGATHLDKACNADNHGHVTIEQELQNVIPSIYTFAIKDEMSGKICEMKVNIHKSSEIELTESTQLEGLRDAFTGEPLDPDKGIVKCAACGLYYHTDTWEYLRDNKTGCIGAGCHHFRITPVTQRSENKAKKVAWTDKSRIFVNMEDYYKYFGKTVVFKGPVLAVRKSRFGNHYSIMFENKTWKKGFKAIVFAHNLDAVGGAPFIRSLAGKTVTIRGDLRNGAYGPQLILTHRSMIERIE